MSLTFTLRCETVTVPGGNNSSHSVEDGWNSNYRTIIILFLIYNFVRYNSDLHKAMLKMSVDAATAFSKEWSRVMDYWRGAHKPQCSQGQPWRTMSHTVANENGYLTLKFFFLDVFCCSYKAIFNSATLTLHVAALVQLFHDSDSRKACSNENLLGNINGMGKNSSPMLILVPSASVCVCTHTRVDNFKVFKYGSNQGSKCSRL